MRCVLALFVCTIMIGLTACSTASSKPVITEFRCAVELVFSEQVFRGELVRNRDATELTVCEPSYLDGFTMRYDRNVFTIDYVGETVTMDTVPPTTVVKLLDEVFVDVASQTPSDGEMSGTKGGFEYHYSYQKADGSPLRLEIPSLGFCALFDEVVVANPI